MKVLKVWRVGPRFWVRLIEEDGRLKVKKELIDFGNLWARGALVKEATFFRWGNEVEEEELKKVLPRLLELVDNEGEVWYTREYNEGQFQNKPPSNFLLRESFYKNISPPRIVDLLGKIHNASFSLPGYLTRRFSTYNLAGFEHFTAWHKLPLSILDEAGRQKIKKLLEQRRSLFDAHQNVLTHYEFYGSHLLLTPDNQLKMIDWENVGWGGVTHDLTTLYLRTYSKPHWQEELLLRFREEVGPRVPFADLFAVELLLQSLGNIRYFLRTEEPQEVAEREKALSFFLAKVKEILRGVN